MNDDVPGITLASLATDDTIAVLTALSRFKFSVEFDGCGFMRWVLPDGCSTTWASPSRPSVVEGGVFVVANSTECGRRKHE